MCSFEGAVRAHSLPRWPPNTEVLSPSLGMPLTFTACKSMGRGAAVVLRMSQSDWTVNLPVVKHTLSSYLVSLLVEFTASPKFKPRHGGSEYDGAGSCFSRAVQFSAEAWPLACQPLVAYYSLCIHNPILYIQATCLFLQTSAPAFFGSQTRFFHFQR